MVEGPSSERTFTDGIDRVVEECYAVYNRFIGCFIKLPGVSVKCEQSGIIGYIEHAVGGYRQSPVLTTGFIIIYREVFYE